MRLSKKLHDQFSDASGNYPDEIIINHYAKKHLTSFLQGACVESVYDDPDLSEGDQEEVVQAIISIINSIVEEL